MPMPWTYRHATREWRAILADARDRMGLESDNMAYTAIEGVLRAFRRRLTVEQAIGFAAVLPAVPRAIFVSDWDVTAPPIPFGPLEAMLREAQAHRAAHALTPANAIEATAWALRRAIRPPEFERALAALPPEARAFWHVEGADPSELAPRIV
jgi:uncharacterized protein (DUF2267 family)